jgi:hypothetical protein
MFSRKKLAKDQDGSHYFPVRMAALTDRRVPADYAAHPAQCDRLIAAGLALFAASVVVFAGVVAVEIATPSFARVIL